MKIELSTILLFIIIGLLIFNGFFNKDNSTEKLLKKQNKELTVRVDSVKKEIKLLSNKLENLKRDTVTIIKNYNTSVTQAIEQDSSNANRIIRYYLDDKKKDITEYSFTPLMNEELANVAFRFLDDDRKIQLYYNCMNRENIYEMKLIEQDKVISLQEEQNENLRLYADAVKPAFYDNFYFGAGVTAAIGLAIIIFVPK